MSSSNDPAHPPHPASAWAWPCAVAACLITLVLVVGQLVRGCTPAGIAEAFKPQFRTSCHTSISSSVDKMHSVSKLVVLQSEVSVEIRESSEKVIHIKGFDLDLGTTTVSVRCAGNRIQYYVPMEKVSTGDFSYDASRNRLVVRIPRPRLDDAMVEVQSDPAQLEIQTRLGWARLDNFSGQALREVALKKLRSAVLNEGRSPIHAEAAAARARSALEKVLAPLAGELRSGVELRIDFKS
jgi:hypothetical protein